MQVLRGEFMNNNQNSIKTQILQELSDVCCKGLNDVEKWNEDILFHCTAKYFSTSKRCSRNLISHYFNELYSEGYLIRINSRPTYYIDKGALSESFNIQLFQSNFESIEELKNYIKINKKKKNSVFKNLVGSSGSLSYVIEQCKAAMTYPGNGLPLLLQGQTGTGKSYIAQLLYEYGKEKRIIDKKDRFVTVNCAEYANNPEILMTNLFGYKKGAYTGADRDTPGILAAAEGGVLFLDEVHDLKPECQEKIFLFMDKGIYHMVGDNEKWIEGKVRIIFATTEDPDTVLLKTLLRRIPIIVKIPSLSERPLKEKKELIYYLFDKEQKIINRKIVLSKLAYKTIESFQYKSNIGQMKNIIRASVAKALLHGTNESDILEIHMYDLPEKIVHIEVKDNTFQFDDRTMIEISSILNYKDNDSSLYLMNQSILKQLSNLKNKEKSFESFLEFSYLRLEQYFDYLFFEYTNNSPRINIIENLVNNIFNITTDRLNIERFSNNEISILSKFLFDFSRQYNFEYYLKKDYGPELNQCVALIKERYPSEWMLIQETSALIENSLHITMGILGTLDLFIIIHRFNRILTSARVPGIIIARGYSIASSIAEFTNEFLNQHIFDAIDMHLESDFKVAARKLEEYLKRFDNLKEIIVMVDMGDIENIHQFLKSFKNIDIGFINNVSTRLALDIGCMITEDYSIEQILREASERNKHKYSIVKNRKKGNSVITVCETGIGTAEKIAELLNRSLPKDTELHIFPYDFRSLSEKKLELQVFEKYRVLFIVGTSDPNIPGIEFISIEKIIGGQCCDKLSDLFGGIINKGDMVRFRHNIIRNFSLDNLLDYLTILDSEKIVGSVEKIIDEIQKGLDMELPSDIIMGLYIHISCLIERLIIDKHIIKFDNLDEFIIKHKDFIKLVKAAFSDIEKNYNVEIPVSEIGYIYDYIFSRHRYCVKESESSVNDFMDII